jgi:two-component system KDP operon response regulator KdpE
MDIGKETMDSIKALVIDHQSKWISLVYQLLTSDGYEVITCNRGEKAIELAVKENPDVILIEPYLHGLMDGFSTVRKIRSFSNVPILMLSEKTETEDILLGFEVGADDYIEKPFNTKILLARMNAVLRRCAKIQTQLKEIVCNEIVINQAAHKVSVDGQEIVLTHTEYKLLLELAKNRNKVMLHEQLLTAVWGREYQNEVVYLRSFIHTLRRKIEKNPSDPKHILNRSGLGYIFVCNASDHAGKG